MSFTEQVKNELARVVRPDKESRSGELLALLRMGGAIVTGAQGKKGRGIFYGEQRRCPPCPRLPEKRFQSYAVSYGSAGTEAAQEKCVYFDCPAVSGQFAVPWGNGIGSAHGYP